MVGKKKIKANYILYKQEIREKGIQNFIKNRLVKIKDVFLFKAVVISNSKRKFNFKRKELRYLLKEYNYAWSNERTIEVPIGLDYLAKYKGKKILEIGNVLNHYHKVTHDVVDKYEIAPNVINKDVVSFKSRIKYDLIISISTLEHVGWDEDPQEPLKIIKAIENLKSLLKKTGVIIITLPLGHPNPHLRHLIKSNKLGFTKQFYLKRISHLNIWEEADWSEVKNSVYNSKYPNANAIVVGEISLITSKNA